MSENKKKIVYGIVVLIVSYLLASMIVGESRSTYFIRGAIRLTLDIVGIRLIVIGVKAARKEKNENQ